MHFKIKFSCTSHIGKCRKINQDNYVCQGRFAELDDKSEYPMTGSFSVDDGELMGVFDGMGGEMCGEQAAYIAAKEAAQTQIASKPSETLYEFCKKANALICDYADKNQIDFMGTTAAILAFDRNGVILCNIGDSKIFRYTDSILKQISKDHLTESVYGTKPQLYQNLGIPTDEMIIEPFFACGKYHKGDIYLICSDGLTDMLSNEEITEVLRDNTFEEMPRLLLEKALENGGKDNITFILCKIERERFSFIKKRNIKEDPNNG